MAKSQKEVLRKIREAYGLDQTDSQSKVLNLLRMIAGQSQAVPPIQPTAQAPQKIPPTTENVGASMANQEVPKLAKEYPFSGVRKRYNQNGG